MASKSLHASLDSDPPRRSSDSRSVPALFILSIVATLMLCLVRAGEAADPCALSNFSAPTNITVTAPRAVVVDDFNKDGNPDIASAANRTSGTISVLLGNGTGGFTGPTNFNGGRNATFMASGDLNNDTNPDLVIANQSNTSGELSILFGNGMGGFGAQKQIFVIPLTTNVTTSVAIGEVDGDGKNDLVLTSSTFSSVTILKGDGMGNFTFLRSFSSGGISPSQVVLKDLNDDNKIDLVVTNQLVSGQTFGNVASFIGDGSGNFSAPSTVAVGVTPVSVAVADFNNNNRPDVAVVNNGSNSLSILLGDGTGGFTGPTTHGTNGTSSQTVVAADFNGDTKIDLAVFNGQPGNAVIFQGDGLGGFAAVTAFSTAGDAGFPTAGLAAVGDFNRDERPDLVNAREMLNRLVVLLNTCGSPLGSNLQFTSSTLTAFESTLQIGGGNGTAVVTVTRVGDISGSASVSFATSDGSATAPQDYTPVSGTLNFAPRETFKQISINLIDDKVHELLETFNVTLSNVVGDSNLGSPSTITVTILDDDPVPTLSIDDVTVVEGNSGTTNMNFTVSLSHPTVFTVMVNYASANGTATAGSDYQSASNTLTFNPGEISKNITIIINGDVIPEISETLLVNLSNPTNATLSDMQGLGLIADEDLACPSPSFAPATSIAVGSGPFAVVSGDFNNDGKSDLASANVFSNNVTVLLGNGMGGFAAPTNLGVGNAPQSIAVGDFNGDNRPDLVTANLVSSTESSISVLLADMSGGFLPAATTSPVAGSRAVAVGDFNADTMRDLVVVSITGNTMSLLLGNGNGTFGAPASFAVGTNPVGVAVGDLNGDSKLDAVVSNQNSQNISILLGDGVGGFAPAVNVTVGGNPQATAIGDFNGDNKPDLAVANATKTVSVFLGDGNGGFTLGNSVNVAQLARSVTAADLNGDNQLDLMVPNADDQFANGALEVFFGNGTGSFSPGNVYVVGFTPNHVAVTDLNGDMKPDLAVSNVRSNNISVLLNSCGAMPTLQLSTASHTVMEGTGPAVIRVTRSGDVRSEVSIDYATSDTSGLANCNVINGAASSKCDYTASIGTLRFLAGETSKDLTILITDDAYVEGDETFNINLSNPVGATLSSPSMATVIIVDDNESLDAPNSIDQAVNFARQHYHDFLNRKPDPAGLMFWANEIIFCGNDPQCIEIKRINVSAAFFLSIEFQETGFLVYRMYKTAYGDTTSPNVTVPVPIIRLNEFLPDAQRIGEGVQVGIGDWQAQLEANKNAFAREFVMRPRFLTAFPLSVAAEPFVDKLNMNAGNVLSQSERDQLIAELNAPGDLTQKRASVFRKVAEDADLKQQENNRAFVLMQYYGYLRRNPDDPQDMDFRGWEFWLNKLNQFNGNFVQAEMVKAFISSLEYRQRFGP